MSTRTVSFSHRVNGVLTNATSVVLSSPDGTFGVKRNDTDAVVVADGTALTNTATGLYSHTFTEPAAGLEYTAYVEWVYAGETYRVEKTLAGVTSYTGRYTTLDEITTFLDSLNYTVHTDSDRDNNSDLAAAVQGHKTGEARIDLRAGGPYTFADSTAGESAAAVFNHWAYKLASYEYAAKRGFASGNENEFVKIRDEVFEEIDRFVADRSMLPGAIPPETTDASDEFSDVDAPISVLPTVDRDGRTITSVPVGPYYDSNLRGFRW
jgi:hypothetical protein